MSKVFNIESIDNCEEPVDRVKPSSVIAYSQGYAAGLKEGRKLERRALDRWIKKQESEYWHDYTNLKVWLAARAKRGKGK